MRTTFYNCNRVGAIHKRRWYVYKEICLVKTQLRKIIINYGWSLCLPASGVSSGISIYGCKMRNMPFGISIDGCILPFKLVFYENRWVQLGLSQNWWVQLHPLTHPNDDAPALNILVGQVCDRNLDAISDLSRSGTAERVVPSYVERLSFVVRTCSMLNKCFFSWIITYY